MPNGQTYLKTRVSILSSRLLNCAESTELLEMPLDELQAQYFPSAAIEDGMPANEQNLILERSLINTLMFELSVLTRPLTGSARNLLVYWSRKFELFNLKTLIRGKFSGLDMQEINSNLHDLPASIALPHDELLQAENVLEMLRLLEHGPYAYIARQARKVYETKNEAFSLDAAIDRSYFSGLIRAAEITDSADKKALRPLIGDLIDRQNILWLYRYRFRYQLSPSETYYLLIPAGRLIDRDKLMHLANLNSFNEIAENLPTSLAESIGDCTNVMEIRQHLDQQTGDECRRLIAHSPSSVTRALAYMVARQTDLANIRAILQGRTLGLDNELIREASGVAVCNERMAS